MGFHVSGIRLEGEGERPLLAYTAIYYIKEGRCPRDIGRKIRFAGRSFVDFMKQESWNSEVKFIYATLRVPRDFPEATIKTNPKNCLKKHRRANNSPARDVSGGTSLSSMSGSGRTSAISSLISLPFFAERSEMKM